MEGLAAGEPKFNMYHHTTHICNQTNLSIYTHHGAVVKPLQSKGGAAQCSSARCSTGARQRRRRARGAARDDAAGMCEWGAHTLSRRPASRVLSLVL